MKSKPTCCVVGAGIGGLHFACELLRDGYEVVLIERANDASKGGRIRSMDGQFNEGAWRLRSTDEEPLPR